MRAAIASLLGYLAAASAQPLTPDVDLGMRPPQFSTGAGVGVMMSQSSSSIGGNSTEPVIPTFSPTVLDPPTNEPALPERIWQGDFTIVSTADVQPYTWITGDVIVDGSTAGDLDLAVVLPDSTL